MSGRPGRSLSGSAAIVEQSSVSFATAADGDADIARQPIPAAALDPGAANAGNSSRGTTYRVAGREHPFEAVRREARDTNRQRSAPTAALGDDPHAEHHTNSRARAP